MMAKIIPPWCPQNERTPLHSAAEGGHVDAVNKLLECKADLHRKDKVSR